MERLNLRWMPAVTILLFAACAPTQSTETASTTESRAATVAAATVAPSATASPVPSPTSSASVAPHDGKREAVPTPTPAPSGSPAPANASASPTAPAEPTAAPSEKPTHEPAANGVPMLAPDAAPKIVSYDLSATTVHSGDTITGHVVTSSNVASVEARIAGYGMPMAKTGVGEFALSYTIPNIPFFLRKTYPLTIVARNTRGDQDTRTIPIVVR